MLKRIRLEMGRTPESPNGNPNKGYEFIAPLDDDGHIDVEIWRAHKEDCIIRRFWEGEDDAHGNLIHTRHRSWAFSYAPGEDDDEPFFKFESHAFVEGEYVSITGHDGELEPFRVVSVRGL